MHHHPPFQWFRIFLSFFFFLGGGALVFWTQGFRFSGQEFMTTGVLVPTSTPPSSVFLEGKYLGKSGDVFLGITTGKKRICFIKDNYDTWCGERNIGDEKATKIRNILLLPHFRESHLLGSEKEIYWHPSQKAFLRFFPSLKTILLYTESKEEIPYINTEKDFLSFLEKFPLPKGDTLFLKENEFLFWKKNILFLQKTKQQKQEEVASFSDPIETAFFLQGSESFIVSTKKEIFFFSHPQSEGILLGTKDKTSHLRHFSNSSRLFWKKEGLWWELQL